MKLAKFELDFARSTRVPYGVSVVLLSLLLLLLLAALSYLDARQTVGVRRAEKKLREVSATVVVEAPRRNADESKALTQEVKAVNRQIRQLNQTWDVLLGDLRSFPGGDVRLLAVDVDAHSGSVRIVGVAADVATMTDYAAYLAEKKSLQAVMISRHELEAGGVRFMVDGKWAEKL